MNRAVLGAVLMAGLASAPEARANENDELEELLNENVVGGASKTLESAADAPATVSTLTAEDMRRYGIRSLNEAINFLGMGLITQDPLHSVEIGGRGVLLTSDYGNHVLVVVDGHSVNEQWDGTAYFEQAVGIPIEMIDHIELILGPGSVLYGGTAMLAVINIVTKSARSDRGLHFLTECGASPDQSGGDLVGFHPGEAYACRLGAGVGWETIASGVPLELVAHVEGYLQRGPPFSWGPQVVENPNGEPADFGPKTAVGRWSGVTHEQYFTQIPTAHVRLTFGDLKLSLHAESYARGSPVPGFATSFGNFDDPRTYELDRWLWGDVKYSGRVGRNLQLSIRAYGDLYDYQEFLEMEDGTYCTLPVPDSCRMRILGEARWGGIELQGLQDWTGDERFSTLVGAEARTRWIGAKTESFDAVTDTSVGSVGAKTDTDFPFAFYLQQRFAPVRQVAINAGARFDHDPRGGQHLSPRVALVLANDDRGVLKIVYSEAFRSPTFYEYYYESADQLPNPDLASETVRSIEASIEQRFGAHRLMLGVFRSWWLDMAQLELVDPESEVYQYRNTSALDNIGFNAGVDGTLQRFSYGASLTAAHTRRRFDSGDASLPLTVAPQLFGNARIAYVLPDLWPTVALAAWFVGPRLADRAFDGDFPLRPEAPTDVEARLTFSGVVPGVDGLDYRLAATVASSAVSPYVAGPNQAVGPDGAPAELTPINRLTVFLTVQYTLFR